MQKFSILLLGCLLSCFLSTAQNTFVPDDNFEQRLIDLGYDTAPLDDFVPTANINTVTNLSVINRGISDLTGIEDFTLLESLNADTNNLTTLDLTANTNLEILSVTNNQLSALDLSGNPLLTSINLTGNQLTAMDFSDNTLLANCILNFNTISNLDISNNPNISNLSLLDNNLNSFVAPDGSFLDFLQLSGNPLTTIDVTNATFITYLEALDGELSTIDLSENTFLSALLLSNNNFESIDISQNEFLFAFWIDDNPLLDIDTSLNLALREIRFGNTLLPSINLSLNTELQRVDGRNNPLLCYIDIRNGNNTAIDAFFNTLGSPLLECIFVDNVSYSETTWTDVDAIVNFATDEANCMAQCCPPDFDFEFTEANVNATVERILVSMNGNAEDFLYSLDSNENYQENNIFFNVPPGPHTIFVTDINGCVEKSIVVIVPRPSELTIPKYFTPNSDGDHDFWKVQDPNNEIESIFIFDRYGKLLKELSPSSSGWDGIYNGNRLPTSDFWYRIELRNNEVLNGHFTLRR